MRRWALGWTHLGTRYSAGMLARIEGRTTKILPSIVSHHGLYQRRHLRESGQRHGLGNWISAVSEEPQARQRHGLGNRIAAVGKEIRAGGHGSAVRQPEGRARKRHGLGNRISAVREEPQARQRHGLGNRIAAVGKEIRTGSQRSAV